MRDFTLTKYKELCTAIINSEYIPVTVKDYCLGKIPEKFIILRHDVDRAPGNALKMAMIENKFGMNTTYYFRTIPGVFRPEIIKEIKGLGHEIGYHYEVLDKSKGDYDKAIKLFENELKKSREICEIKTICMHGNPLTPWNNKDLWKHYEFKKYGIIGEAYLSINYSNILYFSDTGRTWSNKYSVKDIVNTHHSIKTTQDLTDLIKENEGNIYIVTHPQRWDNSFIPWLRELTFQSIKNIGKVGIKCLKSSQVINYEKKSR